MRILFTNDDGIEAAGLQRLYERFSERAECFVIAPDQGRSCCGHSVTTGDPLHVNSHSVNQWSVSGTPADCVRVGLLWLNLKPDWVISGVNHGGNLGVDILYSGTVAGAREAHLLGYPAIAISQYMRGDIDRDWSITARRAERVLETIVSEAPVGLGFWNINLPALPSAVRELDFPISQCNPESLPLTVSFLEHSLASAGDEVTSAQRLVYKSNYQMRPRSQGSDVDLCFQGHATVSRLSIQN